jgi:hypothetical protein
LGLRQICTLTLTFGVLLGSASSLHAQDGPRVDLAAGYAFLHDQYDGNFPLGWAVALHGRVISGLGLVGEIGGNYQTIPLNGAFNNDTLNLHVHTFMAGLRLSSSRPSGVSPFAQVTAGVLKGSADVSGGAGSPRIEVLSGTLFCYEGALGADLATSRNAAIRLQGGLRGVPNNGETSLQARFFIGIVLRN